MSQSQYRLLPLNIFVIHEELLDRTELASVPSVLTLLIRSEASDQGISLSLEPRTTVQPLSVPSAYG